MTLIRIRTSNGLLNYIRRNYGRWDRLTPQDKAAVGDGIDGIFAEFRSHVEWVRKKFGAKGGECLLREYNLKMHLFDMILGVFLLNHGTRQLDEAYRR